MIKCSSQGEEYYLFKSYALDITKGYLIVSTYLPRTLCSVQYLDINLIELIYS